MRDGCELIITLMGERLRRLFSRQTFDTNMIAGPRCRNPHLTNFDHSEKHLEKLNSTIPDIPAISRLMVLMDFRKLLEMKLGQQAAEDYVRIILT